MNNVDLDSYKTALSMLSDDDDTPAAAVAAIAAPPLSEERQREAAIAKVKKCALPDDLRVLALEFDLRCERRLVTHLRQDVHVWWQCVHIVESLLGRAWKVEPAATTLFGTNDQFRLRLDMIVSQEILERRLRLRDGGYGFALPLQWENTEGKQFTWNLAHAKLFQSFAYAISPPSSPAKLSKSFVYDEESGWYGYRRHVDIDLDDFYNGDRIEPGGFAKWAQAAQTTDKHLDRFFSLADACNGDVLAISDTLDRLTDTPSPVSFLVPGLIPRGVVTLLLGDKKTGKSAVAMELAVGIARKESHWLGFPLAPCKGHAVYLLGEDSPGEAARRVQSMTGGEVPDLLFVIPADGTELDGLLETLKRHKVDCLIVDPARKYHTGNEDDSTEISNMLNKLQAFAAAKNCAVIVLHHLKRGAVIKSINDLGTSYRGSGVYTDRARVTLGLRRAGNETEIGIPAPGGTPLHNHLASEMFAGKRRLRRDEATFRHIPIGMTSTATAGSNGAASKKDVPAETAASVERVAVQLLQSGERVTKTGKAAIFERKIDALSKFTRAATRAAVDSLVADGRLCSDTAGALSLPVAASVPVTLEDMI